MPRKTKESRVPPIAFRAGPHLGVWIADFARQWKLSEHETAKRLAALAACGIGVDHYDKLVEKAQILAGRTASEPDFVAACAEVRANVDGADRARLDMKKPALTGLERVSFVDKVVRSIIID
jgi:hypothetical protein